MAKEKKILADRNGNPIKVGCKVRYDKCIWGVGYSSPNAISLFRFKKIQADEETCILVDDVKPDEVEVIVK